MLLFLLCVFFLFLKKIFFFFHKLIVKTLVFMSEAIKENDIKLIIIFFFDFLITFNFWNNMFELCLKYLLLNRIFVIENIVYQIFFLF